MRWSFFKSGWYSGIIKFMENNAVEEILETIKSNNIQVIVPYGSGKNPWESISKDLTQEKKDILVLLASLLASSSF